MKKALKITLVVTLLVSVGFLGYLWWIARRIDGFQYMYF